MILTLSEVKSSHANDFFEIYFPSLVGFVHKCKKIRDLLQFTSKMAFWSLYTTQVQKFCINGHLYKIARDRGFP